MNYAIRYLYKFILHLGATVISCNMKDNAVVVVLDMPKCLEESQYKSRVTIILYPHGENSYYAVPIREGEL